MSRFHFVCGLILATVTLNAVPLSYDFTTPNAIQNYGGTLRGKSSLKNGLFIPPSSSKHAQGYVIPNAPEQTPSGGFSFQAEFRISGQPGGEKNLILWDNLYIYAESRTDANAHKGLMAGLIRNDNGSYRPFIRLGFGSKTETLYADTAIPPDRNIRLGIEYDGISRVSWMLDGEPLSGNTAVSSGGPLAQSINNLVIGDRVGSYYSPFNGTIRRISLEALPEKVLKLTAHGRLAFLRGESDAILELNFAPHHPLNELKVSLRGVLAKSEAVFALQNIPAGQETTFRLPLETNFLKGEYPVLVHCQGVYGDNSFSESWPLVLKIGPLLPVRMPVVMWGGPTSVALKHGFTHGLHQRKGYEHGRTLGPDLQASELKIFDNFLARGYRGLVHFVIPKELISRYPRLKDDGTPRNTPETSNPELRQILFDNARVNARQFANHPGLDGILLNTEKRDSTVPSFGPAEKDAYRTFSGSAIPPEVKEKTAPHFSTLGDRISAGGTVKDSDPLLNYYRWFWREGDGWNTLNSELSRIYHEEIKRPFWTFFDPAVRVPPLWGSGGGVDYLNHWTYAYPEPFRVAAVTAEVMAMAQGVPEQQVMAMTQIICYRSQTAPLGQSVESPPAWLKENMDSEAKFITIPPDSLQEAVWSMLARPVKGIMFHGYNSLLPGGKSSYRLTNPNTAICLRSLLKEVVEPLGPMLMQLPTAESEIGFFESFSSTIFARRGSWGWRTWVLDAHLVLHWAKLDPKVIFMPPCDVLSEKVVQKLREFQCAGGIIIADETIAPALLPNLSIRSIERPVEDAAAKTEFQRLAGQLRKELEPFYHPFADTSDPDLLLYRRRWQESDYIFVINDKRAYGNYIGQWKRVMEKGMPTQGKLTVQRSTGAVYELSRGGAVPFISRDGQTELDLNFQTNDGRLLLFLDREIAGIELTAPEAIRSGETLKFSIRIVDRDKQSIPALLPLEIRLSNGETELDCSGYASAVDGVYQGDFLIPRNIRPGAWQLSTRERAAGHTATHNIQITDKELKP